MNDNITIDKDYLQKTYWDEGKSIHVIAEALNTYPNKVRRSIIKIYGKLRTKSEAQKNALALGVSKHPTEGRERSEAERKNISKSVAKKWDEISDDERERRVVESKKRWDKIPKEKRADMSKKAAEAVRKAAKEGSYLERFLLDELKKQGYNILFHQEAIGGTKMHVDLFVPEIKTAIEIDGPSHFYPIWGAESLANHKKWDAEKNAILMKNGFHIIRVKVMANTLSLHNKTETLNQLIEHLKRLTLETSPQLLEIEVT